jgi:hypothetical protein
MSRICLAICVRQNVSCPHGIALMDRGIFETIAVACELVTFLDGSLSVVFDGLPTSASPVL